MGNENRKVYPGFGRGVANGCPEVAMVVKKQKCQLTVKRNMYSVRMIETSVLQLCILFPNHVLSVYACACIISLYISMYFVDITIHSLYSAILLLDLRWIIKYLYTRRTFLAQQSL